ncbi:peptide/nickel transport system substrate-binding protein/dipeptide transport system substrate-binding protein [Pseudomonas duriflava]|uniref:Peptide/nickel transport system substrate-binding protein/dipeptide transport system substrate-binding protein n=1 Tax=Pseudomonas duriflava TaxID=459528 RepID=A0A562QE03_9PSED|nr:ABC transporter substrate-binding protein [Pseudomonas duriflava]TWI54400.1 peptide/nickel transport system substrate-binding protein/dipeptide transport system substrate-binding protein [Pseudomonas duriflava]
MNAVCKPHTWLLAAVLTAALPIQAKTLVVCTEGSPETFDPARHTSRYSADAADQPLYNRLVDFKPGSTELEPSLAERWEISTDGLQYTFHLRKGVAFHHTAYFKPTRPLIADDVIWSFQRQIDPAHPWYERSGTGYPFAEVMGLSEIIERIEKLDDYTVRFTLKHPEAPFLANLAMGFTSILSAEYAGQLLQQNRTDDLSFKPVGTGPFVFDRYVRDSQVRYKANPEYWAGTPAIDMVQAISVDASVRLQRLRRGECQIVLTPKPSDIPALREAPGIRLQQIEQLTIGFNALNTTHKPLDDVRVRQAIALGVDRASTLKALYGDTARPVWGPYPPALLGYNTAIEPWPYDPEEARRLLAEAGYPNGFELTYMTSNGSGPTGSTLRVAQLFQADLAKIGIKVNIRQYEWGEFVRRGKQGEHDILSMSWVSDNADPDNFLTPNLTCAAARNGENRARWCNAAFDSLVERARRTPDPEQRAALYREAQVIFHEEVPWIPTAQPLIYTATSTRVSGFVMSPLGNNDFSTVRLD